MIKAWAQLFSVEYEPLGEKNTLEMHLNHIIIEKMEAWMRNFTVLITMQQSSLVFREGAVRIPFAPMGEFHCSHDSKQEGSRWWMGQRQTALAPIINLSPPLFPFVSTSHCPLHTTIFSPSFELHRFRGESVSFWAWVLKAEWHLSTGEIVVQPSFYDFKISINVSIETE